MCVCPYLCICYCFVCVLVCLCVCVTAGTKLLGLTGLAGEWDEDKASDCRLQSHGLVHVRARACVCV